MRGHGVSPAPQEVFQLHGVTQKHVGELGSYEQFGGLFSGFIFWLLLRLTPIAPRGAVAPGGAVSWVIGFSSVFRPSLLVGPSLGSWGFFRVKAF